VACSRHGAHGSAGYATWRDLTAVGPADGSPVLLLHGWPYDIHSFAEVAPLLALAGYRVVVPFVRGYGTTRFLSDNTLRNGQQAALATEVIALMDALGIAKAVLGGLEWGARSADVVAALWPDRCQALVSVSGYLIGSQAASHAPLPPQAELAWWYQFYFATDRGQAGYDKYRRDFSKLIWRLASPKWVFDDATFARSAAAFDNPDHVAIAIHNYRWRLGLGLGEAQYDDLERRLASFPAITVPAITLERETPTARRTRTPAPTPANSPARTSTGSSRAASGTTCRKSPLGLRRSNHRRRQVLTGAQQPGRSSLGETARASDVVEQFGPEQGRRDAVVDPDGCPPPGVRRHARLDGVLIRRGHDRRDVVGARMIRPVSCIQTRSPTAIRRPGHRTGGGLPSTLAPSSALHPDFR
jgi:pimeloyl-ACP methyl ester carboxylesterase